MAKKKHPYKRRTVEIYFVLYLSALIFILPNKKDMPNNHATSDRFVAELPFNIFPEKTNLNARLTIDSLGSKILSLDSVNNIFYSGDVKNVNYEFVVYDAMMKQSYQVKKETVSKHYRIVRNDRNKSVAFYWKPTDTDKENKSYIVRVVATAEPTDGKYGIVYKAKTQFSLNLLTNSADIPSDSDSGEIMSPFDKYNFFLDSIRKIDSEKYRPIAGDFDLSPEREIIRQVSFQKWVNVVNTYNINLFKDLKNKPQILISGSANQRYHDVNSEIYSDKIILSGITPPSGKINIKVVLDRKNDSKQKSINFSVMPLALESPNYDKKMYAGKTYMIDPQLPMLDRDTKAFIKYDEKIIAESPQGTKFRFTPSRDLIGKVLKMERYIDNSIIQEENRIIVADYPGPEIISIQEVRSGEVEVMVKSYGNAGTEKNLVSHFDISGNASFRELFGRFEENKDGFARIQTFLFKRKKSDGNFEFSITAIDKSGKKSKNRTYSAE